MKKRKSILILLLLIAFPIYLNAGTFMFGVKSWYAQWDSGLGKTLGGYFHDYLEASGTPNTTTIKPGNGYLAGPLIGYQTEDRKISFSAAAMVFSSFSQETEFKVSGDSADLQLNLERKDLDFSMSYSLTDYLKIFFGYKFMYSKADLKFVFSDGSELDGGWYQASNSIYSIGAGTVYPLTDRTLLSGQIGMLFVKTKFESKYGTTYDVENSTGYTAEIAFNYLISESIFLQAGLKYQTFTFKNNDWGTNEKDSFMGITLAAIYMW